MQFNSILIILVIYTNKLCILYIYLYNDIIFYAIYTKYTVIFVQYAQKSLQTLNTNRLELNNSMVYNDGTSNESEDKIMNLKFSEIVKEKFPRNTIIVIVGDIHTVLGKKSNGLDDMKPEQIKYLDAREPLHYWKGNGTIQLVYRKSKKYDRIVWGE